MNCKYLESKCNLTLQQDHDYGVSVNVEPCVDNDPCNEEASGTSEETFLGQFPSPTILCLIYALKVT